MALLSSKRQSRGTRKRRSGGGMLPLPDETIDNIFFAGLLATHALTFLSAIFPRFTLFFAHPAHRTRKLGFCFWLLASLTLLLCYGIYTDADNSIQSPEDTLIVAGLFGVAFLAMSGFLVAGRLLRHKTNTGIVVEQDQPPVVSGGNYNGKVVD